MNKVTREDRMKATRLVKAYLKKNKRSQATLAVELDCYPSQISYIKNGVRVPGTIIRRVLKLLDVTETTQLPERHCDRCCRTHSPSFSCTYN